MDYSNTMTIQLTVGSKTYPWGIDRRDESVYREASKLINTKVNRYIHDFPEMEKEDYLAMALIDIAVSLVQETDVDRRIGDMIQTIDKEMKLNK